MDQANLDQGWVSTLFLLYLHRRIVFCDDGFLFLILCDKWVGVVCVCVFACVCVYVFVEVCQLVSVFSVLFKQTCLHPVRRFHDDLPIRRT